MPDTVWDKTKKYSGTAYSKALKPGFDKAWATVDKLGAPVNKLTNKLGSEAFWPTTLDKESDKAARILRSFCKDGFYEQIDEAHAQKAAETGEKIEGPRGKQRVLKKIPEKVIRQAKGLAIFTTMRTGLWVSGAGGSGILVARNPENGEWSPPSGILLHTAGLGFLVGVDIYDCVVVINTYQALEAFTKIRCTLGGEVSAVAGPVGIGGLLETEVHKRQAPVWTYLKSRGFYAGIQVDGTIIIERTDENERFYGERIPVADILAGKARYPPKDKYQLLMNTIGAAQGDDVDESLLPKAGEPTPGDQELEPGTTFGIPDVEDPDPFGVKALENEGIQIREAATQERPSAEVFEFRPAATSPVFANFTRKSLDSLGRARHDSWRTSVQSVASINRGTQTDEESSPVQSPFSESASRQHSPSKKTAESLPEIVDEEDDHKGLEGHEDVENADVLDTHKEREELDGHNEEETEDEAHSLDGQSRSGASTPDEDVEVFEAQSVVAQAKVVTIPKRVPPSLPPRNPQRMSTPVKELDDSTLTEKFDEVSLDADHDADHDVNDAAQEEQFHSAPPSPSKEVSHVA